MYNYKKKNKTMMKLFEEFINKKGEEIDLGLEIENMIRKSTPNQLKSIGLLDLLSDFGVEKDTVDGKEMGKVLMDQMKYKKLSDEEFDDLYNDYKKNK